MTNNRETDVRVRSSKVCQAIQELQERSTYLKRAIENGTAVESERREYEKIRAKVNRLMEDLGLLDENARIGS